jgi:zinc transport system permease protein
VPVRFLYTLMIIMLAVSVVMIIQVVGLILVIALLTIGPFIVEKYTKSLAAMMLWSSLLNVAFAVGGLWLSYAFNLTSGAAIILVAASGFFLDQLYYRLQGGRQRQPSAG